MKSDSELWGLALKGKEEAFVSLYERHQGPVFRFALHMSGKVETAEEIVQDVFLSLLSAPKRFVETSGTLQGYLIGAARNMIRDRLKRQGQFADADRSVATDMDMTEKLSTQERLRDLHAAILSLPPRYREAVVLCDLEEMDYASAAAHLGCPVGTVRSRLHRARSLLLAKLRNHQRCPA